MALDFDNQDRDLHGDGHTITFPQNGSVDSERYGEGSTALDQGTSVGKNAHAGERGVAIGKDSNSGLPDSVAVGENASCQGLRCVSIGENAEANPDNSVSIGQNSRCLAVGIGSQVAIGQDSESSTDGGIAIGTSSKAGGIGSIAIGKGALVTGMHGQAYGEGVVAGANQAVFGKMGGGSGIDEAKFVGTSIEILKVIATGMGADKTGIFFVVDNGGEVVRQVEMGAVDSGGLGYRMLRVLN